ncbi:MAG: hypothetical protein AAFX39_07960 [Pseudomonadota bacterium]
MPSGTIEDFLFSLKAFESGWDRPRYEVGIIADWQLNEWAGGTVQDFFPQYDSWGDLTAREWDVMSYRSMNAFGFVGYQFGEALLIDLGYYDDDVYYLNGASTNTWDGTWTGKNGATSLEAFMTAEVQDRAMYDAFGFNLSVIENQLGAAGRDLDEFLGETATYVRNGEQLSVELTLTGVLAAAHLRGAWAVADLLLSGTLSFDEFGTSILQYVEQFGGYDSPSIEQLIADWEAGKTGDEGLGQPGDGGGDSGGDGSGAPVVSLGTAGVTAETADVVIDWAWGQDETVPFDPASDTIFVDWINAEALEVFETSAGVVIAVPSNNQRVTLRDAELSDLTSDNFTFNDSSAAQEVLALVGPGSTPPPDNPDTPRSEPGDGGGGVPDGSLGTAGVTAETADIVIDWMWGRDETVPFDAASDTIFVGWIDAAALEVSQTSDGVVIAVPSNNQQVMLSDTDLSELTGDNFTFKDSSAAQEVLALIGPDTSASLADVAPSDVDFF